MGLFDKLKKTEEKESLKTHNLGGCIITRSLYEGTSKLKWIFREEPANPTDNGWRALGDTDTEEYINIPENNFVVDFDRLVEIEPAVLAIYDMPIGTDLENDSQRRIFIDSNTGLEIRYRPESVLRFVSQPRNCYNRSYSSAVILI